MIHISEILESKRAIIMVKRETSYVRPSVADKEYNAKYPAFECIGCHVSTMRINEYYMILNKLWRKVNPKKVGMLCIGCVEDRLGRELTPEDFTSAPVNSIREYSPRLQKRLGFST
jgi:hypothetical protein